MARHEPPKAAALDQLAGDKEDGENGADVHDLADLDAEIEGQKADGQLLRGQADFAQRRSEAATTLTGYGYSPGGLDFTFFLNEQH